MGAGKTSGLTALCWQHWFHRREKIYTNYHLFGIPYYHIKTVDQLDYARDGFLALDELWRILDSYESRSIKVKITADILSKSRKRGLTYTFSSQVISSLSPRIRQIIDFTCYPMLNRDETVLKLLIFRGNKGKKENYLKSVYFRTVFVYRLYDTNQEIEMEVESGEPPKIVFQPKFNKEHGYLCECPECGTKFFDSWEQADGFAEAYWREHRSEIVV